MYTELEYTLSKEGMPVESVMIIAALERIVLGIEMGIATRMVLKSKGYEAGFAWGFLFGAIGLIVTACRKEKKAALDKAQPQKDLPVILTVIALGVLLMLLRAAWWVCVLLDMFGQRLY